MKNHLSLNEEYTTIGKIYKSSILKNSWLAYIDNIKYLVHIKKFKNLLFIEIDGIITPFFLSYYKQINKNKFLLNFDDSTKSENFIGKKLYLNIKKLNFNIHHYNYVIKYQAIDINKGYIGIINKIYDQFPQNLFEIIDNNNQNNQSIILIPIVKNFITSINKIKQIVIFDLPEGLINLFIKLK